MAVLVAAIVALFAPLQPADAAVGHWVEAHGGKFRLIAPGGPPAADGTIWLGLEIALDPGWATYWRTPGDAGIATEVSFARSLNLEGAVLEFPAPARFDEAGSTVIGYTAPVVLPIRATLADPSLPLTLAADAQMGFCQNICVPVDGLARLTVSAATPPDAAAADLIAAARARVPVPGPDGGLAVLSLIRDAHDPAVLTATARLADPAAAADLFAEGPPGTYATLSKAVSRSGDIGVWTVRVSDAKGGAAPGPITLTLVNGKRAITSVATPVEAGEASAQ